MQLTETEKHIKLHIDDLIETLEYTGYSNLPAKCKRNGFGVIVFIYANELEYIEGKSAEEIYNDFLNTEFYYRVALIDESVFIDIIFLTE